jgi:hypothetical protein
MKTDATWFDRWFRCLTVACVLASGLVPSIACAAGGVVDQSIDGLYNLKDQLQGVVMKSYQGLAYAMQDGPPPDPGGRPWTLDDLKQIQQKNANLLGLNNTLYQNQQKLADVDARLLKQLPANDPRRSAVTAELTQIASQMSDTRTAVQNFQNKANTADAAVEQWKQRHDPNYVPPPPKMRTDVPAPSVTPSDAPPPPKEDDNKPTVDNAPPADGPADNGLAALKAKEAEQEAATRTLGKQRQAAVNTYLDDPTDENKAAAQNLRNQLDGMVDDLNALRGQVDTLEGTSRPPIHVRSGKSIAAERQKLKNSNTDAPPNEGGGGSSGCASGGETSKVYEEVASGSASGVSKHSHSSSHGMRKGTSTNGVSSQSYNHPSGAENHHHATSGTTMPNQNLQTQTFPPNGSGQVHTQHVPLQHGQQRRRH